MTTRLKGWRVFAALLSLALVAGACGSDDNGGDTGAGSSSEASTTVPAKKLELTMGSSQASSSVFAFLTAHGRLAAQKDGNMTVNIRETNASVENIQLVNDRAIEFGISSWELNYLAHNGLQTYAGKATPNVVTLMNYLLNGEFIMVRADSGINTLKDLEGKSFAPSFQGSSVFAKYTTILKELGVNFKPFVGSLDDIINGVKDGRVVGFGKSANGLRADASMLDVHSAVPMKPIGLTDAEITLLKAKYPYYVFADVPAGVLGDSKAFKTTAIYSNYLVHKDMPEEDAYRLTKALWATVEEAAKQANYDGAKGRKPEETLSLKDLLPIHPGAQKYYKEVGALK